MNAIEQKNRKFIETFLKRHGISTPDKVDEIVSGFDLNKPVYLTSLTPDDHLFQFVSGGWSINVPAHRSRTNVVVRHQVTHVAAGPVLVDGRIECGNIDWAGPTVAGHDRRDTLKGITEILACLGALDWRIAMRMQVDEARSDDQILGVDFTNRTFNFELPYRRYSVALDRDVADDAGPAGAVVKCCPAEQNSFRFRCRSNCQSKQY